MTIHIRKVAVLGAGVMGAQIAAHCINARVPVVLFDLKAPSGAANSIVTKAIEGLKKLSPAPLGDVADAARIKAANYDDDLALLADCDLVIEAVAERMDIKHGLYAKVSPHLAPHAIFASNTSGLSISALSDGFAAQLKSRFCGVHFFNPPRYMHLVELIATKDTAPAVLDELETFLVAVLGKGVVRAKDTPNFIANRVGIFSILATFIEAEKAGLSYDLVDDLTGAKLGRAKSGTFRTADVVGLDTMGHVIRTMQDKLGDDPFHAVYATPKALSQLIEAGALGQKTGAGFYKKVGRDIQRYDAATAQYVAGGAKADDVVVRILKKKDAAERLKLLHDSKHPQAQFLWAILRDTFQYVAVHLQSIASSARDIDLALRFGFGQSMGPFELWQAAGWKQIAQWVKEDIEAGRALSSAALPDWVFDGRDGVNDAAGSFFPGAAPQPSSALPVYLRQARRATVFGGVAAALGETISDDESARLALFDGVTLLSIKTKMHAIGPGVIAAIHAAVSDAEEADRPLVIYSPDEPFSVGADLAAMLPLFMSGGVSAIEPEVKKLQDAMLRLRYAAVPTIAAVSGMALGGGLELALACSQRAVAFECYMGLVEVGVGLVPGGGGLTYGARRAFEQHRLAPDSYLLDFVKRYFSNAATAAVSKSALEARNMGYLEDCDTVVMNSYELLSSAVAKGHAALRLGYRPPLPANAIEVAGRSGLATITAQLINLRDGGFISAHDFHLGKTIAEVMCGGDLDEGELVDEAWLLGAERRAFMSLLNHPKTQERIMGMMQTGKPVRN